MRPRLSALLKFGRALRGLPARPKPESATPTPRRPRPGRPKPGRPAPPERPGDGQAGTADGVRFEYSPEMDGDPDPGEVVWTWVTYEDDPSQGKDRPVVLVGRRGRALIGVALTSRQREGAGADEQFPVGTGAWDREGRPSWAKLDRLIEVAPSAMRREGAVLDRQRFDALVDAVRRFHA